MSRYSLYGKGDLHLENLMYYVPLCMHSEEWEEFRSPSWMSGLLTYNPSYGANNNRIIEVVGEGIAPFMPHPNLFF